MTTTRSKAPPHARSGMRLTPRLQRWLKRGGIGLLIILFIGQLYLDYSVVVTHQNNNTTGISGLIIEAIRASNKPALLDPVSKRVYLPDASLVLPTYPADLSEVRYSYTPPIDGTDAEASVTTTTAMNMAIGKLRVAAFNESSAWRADPSTIFEQVPNAQVCTRGLHVVFGDKTTYDRLEFQKQLNDGRTMKVYSEKSTCSFGFGPLLDYLKEAQSY